MKPPQFIRLRQPHYPVVHREARRLPSIVTALCIGILLGIIATLMAIALTR